MARILGGRVGEYVEISRAENDGVENLGNERDACDGQYAGPRSPRRKLRTLSTAVAMYGPHQNELGARVREVAHDAEDVEDHAGRWPHGQLAAWVLCAAGSVAMVVSCSGSKFGWP